MVDKMQVYEPRSISIKSAQELSTTVNTRPQIPSVTPRWLLKALQWVHVDTGIYRLNRVKCHLDTKHIQIKHDKQGHPILTKDTLKSFYLFKNVDEPILDEISHLFVKKEVKIGETIIHEGEEGDNFYIIVNGNFEVSIDSQHGQKIVVTDLKEGDYFGEIALFHEVPRSATVVAKTCGLLYSLTKKSFDKIIQDPQIQDIIKKSIIQRKQELESYTAFGEKKVPLKSGHFTESILPNTFIEYDEHPHEIHLSLIQTIIGINTRISEVYNVPYNQLEQQIRVTTEMILEQQEYELINNKNFGLLHNVRPQEVIVPRNGAPTPYDLDSLLSIVWKKPSFFLAHPRAIAAFGRECTKRGVPPPTIDLYGGTFLTWRGVPLLPTEKLEINEDPNSPSFGTTNMILLRAGEADQGVVGLYKNDMPGQAHPGLTIRFMGIDNHSVANYLLTKYFSLAVLVPDAIGVLKEVEVGNFYDD